jgi:hypothetical protein
MRSFVAGTAREIIIARGIIVQIISTVGAM